MNRHKHVKVKNEAKNNDILNAKNLLKQVFRTGKDGKAERVKFSNGPIRMNQTKAEIVVIPEEPDLPDITKVCQTCGIGKKDLGERINKLKRCSRCKSVYYCGKYCQKKDWKFHKLNCKKIEKITDVVVKTVKNENTNLLQIDDDHYETIDS